jgi:poly(A) polymerase
MTSPAANVARDAAVAVVRTLRDAGHVAYFAGGCVRDALMGLTPKDYDVATDAPPDRVRQLFPRTQAVGAAFGVILVRGDGAVTEVATFRTEGTYSDGRRPDSVTFTSAENDARRRDFTINGLYYDPLDDRVIDYVGGRDDLRRRTLRAIGVPAERFAEDHLRSLRAVRFAARFDLRIDPATCRAIAESASMLPRISAERIADELRRVLTPTWRNRAYALLWELGLMAHLFRTARPPGEPIDAWRSAYLRLRDGQTITFATALAATQLDLVANDNPNSDGATAFEPSRAKIFIDDLRQRLKLSNEETAELSAIVQDVFSFARQPDMPAARMMRFRARPHAAAAELLMKGMIDAGHDRDTLSIAVGRLATLDGVNCDPPPLLNGEDLIAMGYRSGPAFKRALDAVYDAQLEGRVSDKSAAMAFARSWMSG